MWPKVDWEPLTEFFHNDVGHRADPEKKALLSAVTKVNHLSPAIGTKLEGIDLRTLTDTQKDELYVDLGWTRCLLMYYQQSSPGC
jgi:sulfonate dioxygenase